MITDKCNTDCVCYRELEENIFYCAALGSPIQPEQSCLIKSQTDI